MATKSITYDDLDGTENAETIRFGLGEHVWEIDLGEANADKLVRSLQPFIAAGREVIGRKSDNGESAAIREWAARAGIELSPKGRIPSDIVQQYKAAQAA
jgi:hypothetical protein